MPRVQPPLLQLLRVSGIRRVEVASAAGVDLKVIHRLCRGDFLGMKLEILARVAVALGAAPAEPVPELARRPRTGLLYSAGVFKLKP